MIHTREQLEVTPSNRFDTLASRAFVGVIVPLILLSSPVTYSLKAIMDRAFEIQSNRLVTKFVMHTGFESEPFNFKGCSCNIALAGIWRF